MRTSRILSVTALAAAAGLILAGCATDGTSPAASEEPTAPEATSVTVEDNWGEHTIDLPLTSVVATDNRTFQTLYDWGIPLSAAAVSLMPDTVGYVDDESIIDLGNHREPNLEAVVAVEPQLIINGQRFAQYRDDFLSLTPDATIIELDPRDGEPLDAELKRQVTVLGEIFGKQAEATALGDALDAAVADAKDAYDAADTVIAVNVSGGEIGYLAPGVGRTLGPIFDLLDLTPAIEVEDATDDHQGDDISVEAIAAANPTWILVMDRDAAVAADDATYEPASQILENNEALKNVTAIQEGNIIYMPADTYTNEGIQTYTKFLQTFAKALQDAR